MFYYVPWILLIKYHFIIYRETAYDKGIINRYKKALDTAVKIATVYNVQPIRGRTIVLCDCSDQMRVNCTAAKGLGKPRQVKLNQG